MSSGHYLWNFLLVYFSPKFKTLYFTSTLLFFSPRSIFIFFIVNPKLSKRSSPWRSEAWVGKRHFLEAYWLLQKSNPTTIQINCQGGFSQLMNDTKAPPVGRKESCQKYSRQRNTEWPPCSPVCSLQRSLHPTICPPGWSRPASPDM